MRDKITIEWINKKYNINKPAGYLTNTKPSAIFRFQNKGSARTHMGAIDVDMAGQADDVVAQVL